MRLRLSALIFMLLMIQVPKAVLAQEILKEYDTAVRKQLKAIAMATHVYVGKHKGKMPPAAVTNSDLPPNKRLSGFVLLLPYFGEKPDWMDDAAWNQARISPEQATAAKQLYNSFNLKKAWDDPVNLKAARTALPILTLDGVAPQTNEAGYHISHFAFVRGYGGREDGAFPMQGNIMIYDAKGETDWIADGTSETLAIGPITTQLGPWTAAGSSTSRHLYHPSEGKSEASFSGRYKDACYFAKCDGSVHFIDLARSTPIGLRAIVTRSGRDGRAIPGNVRSYTSAEEWRRATEK